MAGCRPLNDDEIALVVNSFEGPYAVRNKCLFLCGIRTGYRISELLAIRVRDVEQHGKILKSLSVEARNMKGGKSGRTIVLHQEAKDAIAAHLADYERKWGRRMDPDMFLFKSQIGKNRPLSRTQVAHFLHEIYDRHKMTGKLGTHSMRKSFAQKMWIFLGKDIVKVQSAMSHANLNSTVKYVCNFAREEIDDAILSA